MDKRVTKNYEIRQLDTLNKGDRAQIIAINEDETLLIKRRLNELGFIPGEKIRVYALAFPAKDPMAIEIGHSIFALRRQEAATITVKIIA